MNDALDKHNPDADDPQVERALREVLGPLDRRLDHLFAISGLALIVTVIAVFLLLWQVWDWQWWAALLWGFAGFLVIATSEVIGIS